MTAYEEMVQASRSVEEARAELHRPEVFEDAELNALWIASLQRREIDLAAAREAWLGEG